MGGGGGGPFVHRTPQQLADLVRQAEKKLSEASFNAQVNGLLTELLGNYNKRDNELVSERLSEVKDILGEELDAYIDTLYGGSVAKHTYVDGLSDIDSLLILDDTALAHRSPGDALAYLEDALSNADGLAAAVSRGQMAVTLDYPDGMSIQLLPAVRDGDRVRIPSSRTDGWSKINPSGFTDALSDANSKCGGKLVPVIKLAKAIIGNLPEGRQLSGYHVESLAIAAFRDYIGDKTASAMLPAFFDRARELVMAPIRDRTGQSVHVDGYLGDEGSSERQRASNSLGRIVKQMRNASAAESMEMWRSVFGIET